jgi:hypothetical protein
MISVVVTVLYPDCIRTRRKPFWPSQSLKPKCNFELTPRRRRRLGSEETLTSWAASQFCQPVQVLHHRERLGLLCGLFKVHSVGPLDGGVGKHWHDIIPHVCWITFFGLNSCIIFELEARI